MPRSSSPFRHTQFFSNALMLLMERNGVNQVDASKMSGVACSRINDYLQGKYRTIRPDHLASLSHAVGRSVEERCELLRAYVMDLLPEMFHGVVRITVDGHEHSANGAGRRRASPLPPAVAGSMAQLYSLCLRDAKARARMQWFVEVLQEARKA